jgi:hypothetical protein
LAIEDLAIEDLALEDLALEDLALEDLAIDSRLEDLNWSALSATGRGAGRRVCDATGEDYEDLF